MQLVGDEADDIADHISGTEKLLCSEIRARLFRYPRENELLKLRIVQCQDAPTVIDHVAGPQSNQPNWRFALSIGPVGTDPICSLLPILMSLSSQRKCGFPCLTPDGAAPLAEDLFGPDFICRGSLTPS